MMTNIYNFYVYTLFMASAFSIIVGIMAIRRRSSMGAYPIIILMSAIFIWTFFQALAFLENNINLKILFANMRYFGIEAAPLSYYALAYWYKNREEYLSLKQWIRYITLPFFMIIALWTNPIHHKFYEKVFVRNGILVLQNGPLYFLNMIYLYGFILVAIIILIKTCIKSNSVYRIQAIIITIAVFIPILSNIVFNLDILPIKDIDITPFSSLITGILYLRALFQYKLLDIVPIARDRLVEEMDDIVIVIDEQKRVLDMNKTAREIILRENHNNYEGKHITLVLGNWIELCEYIINLSNKDSKISYRNNGVIEYYDIRISNIYDKNGKDNGKLIVLRNITELEEALQEAKSSKELAERASMAKGQFLANMSHEIRTPMNAVIGIAEILDNMDLSRSEQKRYIKMIVNSAESLLTVINDILDFSKIEAGKLEIEKSSFNIKESIKDTVETFKVIAEKKKIQLKCFIDENINDHVLGDVVRVRQILINLLGNSLKFTEKGEVTVSLELVRESQGEVLAAMVVSDTGIGISQDKIEVIFESFKQADNTSARKFGGTGLGLSIVKKLLELMGGSIEVKSEAGKGSTFSCYIPLQIIKKTKDDSNHLETEKEVTERLLNLKILLVDDNKINRQIATAYIKKLGCTADFAENGIVAVEKFEENTYDVILMDVQMPEMDGLTATRIIRSKEKDMGKHIPIIALTAGALKEDIDMCKQAGMDSHISKPVKIDKLYEILSQI
ncbi:MAG: histidine kinase N-terminal 7TM domain-containing protein [Bacillota bacterium]|nr:histidine kinase N-terminal 7TM domain-containing protein [Bacillota bacterium]